MEFKELIETNFATFAQRLQEAVLEGWVLDKSNPGDVSPFGFYFAATLHKDHKSAEALRQAAVDIDAPEAPTRAEILAKARAAKAAKQSATLDVENIQEVNNA
jgi:hypothetical protein